MNYQLTDEEIRLTKLINKDTEELWNVVAEASKEVANWPEWKRNINLTPYLRRL